MNGVVGAFHVVFVECGGSVVGVWDCQSRRQGFESTCCHFKTWAFSFTSFYPSVHSAAQVIT